MGKYIVRRLLQMIPVVFGATFIIFAMVFALPGDPLAGKCGERPCPAGVHREVPGRPQPRRPAAPPVHQVPRASSLHGDFGTTFQGLNVADELARRYAITIRLAIIAIVFELVIGILAGMLAGIRKGRVLRQPRAAVHPRRDLHPDLRPRLGLPDLLRLKLGSSRRPCRPRRPGTSSSCPASSSARCRWPTWPG